MAFSKGELMYN